MIKVDLITGFLGAGKTSFLLRYAQYLMDQGLRIGILIYDHGAVNVDLPLLQELRGERCELETLAGGCDADCHRRRFRTKLITMGMSGYDRVLIEPSGVFDMDEFYDTLNESPLDRWYEAGSVIAIWDATLGEEDSPEADFFLASQAAGAGCLVLSKTQLATPERKAQSLVHLQNALKRIHAAPIPAERILDKNWDDLTEEDFQYLTGCGSHPSDYVKSLLDQGGGFQSLSFLNLPLSREALEDRIDTLFRERQYGDVFRVKGFFREGERWYQINATAQDRLIEPVADTRGALIVIGTELNERAIHLLLTGKEPELHIL